MSKPKRVLKPIPTFEWEDAEREFGETADSNTWIGRRRVRCSFRSCDRPQRRFLSDLPSRAGSVARFPRVDSLTFSGPSAAMLIIGFQSQGAE